MSQRRERSELRKNQYFGINEHYLFLFNTYLYVSSLHVHSIDSARNYAYPFHFKIL